MTTPYNLWIECPNSISLAYVIPKHLEGIEDIDSLRRRDLEELDSELKAQGSSLEEKTSSGVIWRMGFPGMILDVTNVGYGSLGNLNLRVTPIHPHRADLSFKQDKTLDRGATPLTIGAVLLDNNDTVILGIRGGSVAAGKVSTFPGGHVDFQRKRVTDVYEELEREFEEELGREFRHGQDTMELIGVMGNEDVQGINILTKISVDQSYGEIVDSWKCSKDRFEHDRLIRATDDQLRDLARTGKTDHEGSVIETTPYFADCMGHYLDSNK